MGPVGVTELLVIAVPFGIMLLVGALSSFFC
jgi:hypothetical protein